MTSDVIVLPATPTKKLNRGNLSGDLLEVAEKDYRSILQQIAAQEIAGQVALGNKPSNIIVDDKKSKPIADVRFKIVAYFVDAAMMLAALNDVWDDVRRLGAHDTGTAESQWQVWIQQGRSTPRYAGDSPAAVNAADITASTGLFVVGPVVAYTRKYRWLRDGGVARKFKASRRGELKGLKMKDKPKVAVSIHEQAATRAARKYRPLTIRESWVPVNDLNTRGKTAVTRIPGVVIRRKAKGRI